MKSFLYSVVRGFSKGLEVQHGTLRAAKDRGELWGAATGLRGLLMTAEGLWGVGNCFGLQQTRGSWVVGRGCGGLHGAAGNHGEPQGAS
jgi:hypothetical protein